MSVELRSYEPSVCLPSAGNAYPAPAASTSGSTGSLSSIGGNSPRATCSANHGPSMYCADALAPMTMRPAINPMNLFTISSWSGASRDPPT